MDNVATIAFGQVEYSREEAQMSVDELIEKLQDAKEDGATHVVALTGNYRGARYMRIAEVEIDY